MIIPSQKSPLDKLNSIPGYAKQYFQGGHYRIKFRASEDKADKITKLGRLYPEMVVHKTTEGKILFGGTFSASGNFLRDLQVLTGIKIKQHG